MSLFLVLAIVLILIGLACASLAGVRLIERRHPATGQFVEVSGGRLHLVELGPSSADAAVGPPVVLLHGASGSLADMRIALGERLARRHRVILIDRPGHGWSDRGGGAGAEPARQGALVVEALDRLGIDRAIMVGHSWAGALVTALALARPARVAGLVLLAPVTHPWPGGISWYYRVAVTPIAGGLMARTLVVPVGVLMLGAGVRHVFAPQPAPEGYVEHAAIALHLRPAEFLANARDVAGLRDAVAEQAPHYSGIAAPVTIITGDRDVTVSPNIHSRALARAVPQAKLIVLPGVGHMPHHAAPDLVVAEIERLASAAPVPQSLAVR